MIPTARTRSRNLTIAALLTAVTVGLALASCSAPEPEPQASGVLLEWLPPSEYDDGSTLPPEALTEFRIYVGQEMVQQLGPDVTEYFLELPAGEWEVSISAVAGGVESRLSEPLTVAVD